MSSPPNVLDTSTHAAALHPCGDITGGVRPRAACACRGGSLRMLYPVSGGAPVNTVGLIVRWRPRLLCQARERKSLSRRRPPIEILRGDKKRGWGRSGAGDGQAQLDCLEPSVVNSARKDDLRLAGPPRTPARRLGGDWATRVPRQAFGGSSPFMAALKLRIPSPRPLARSGILLLPKNSTAIPKMISNSGKPIDRILSLLYHKGASRASAVTLWTGGLANGPGCQTPATGAQRGRKFVTC